MEYLILVYTLSPTVWFLAFSFILHRDDLLLIVSSNGVWAEWLVEVSYGLKTISEKNCKKILTLKFDVKRDGMVIL